MADPINNPPAPSEWSVLDALSAMVAVIDPSGQVVRVNEAWRRFAAANGNPDPTGGLGRSYFAVCLPPDAGDVDVAAGIRAVLECRSPRFEHVYPCHSPEQLRWFRMIVTPLGADDVVGGAVLVHADVTEQKLAEEALRDREALLSNAQRVAGLGMWHLDAPKNHLTWADETCRIFGIEPGSFAGTFEAFAAFIHPDDRDRLLPDMMHPPEGQPIDLEYRIIRPDGTERVILERGEVTYDEAGAMVRKLGVVMDVTERHEADRALRASEDRYRDLIEHSRDLVCTHDLEGRILSVNLSASTLSGYSRDALLQMSMAELLAPDVRPQFTEYLSEIGTNGRASGVLKVQTAGGETRYWEYDNTLRDDGVASPVVRAMARDITDRVVAERKLRLHLRRLIAIIEVQQSLASIEATAEQLLDSVAPLARRLLNADGAVYAASEGDRLVYRSVAGLDESFVGFSVPIDGSLAGQSVRFDRLLRSDDTEHDDRVDAALCRAIPLRSMIVVPLRSGDIPVGVLKVFAAAAHHFTEADESTLALLAETVDGLVERKRAEAALRQSEARLLEAQKIAQLGNWEWNLHTHVLWWSDEIYGMFGIDRTSLAGSLSFDHFMAAVHRDDRDRVRAAITVAVENRSSYDVEMRVVRRDGVERVLHALGKVDYDADGRPQRMRGTAQDVTERRLTERRFEQSNTLVQIAGRVAHMGGWLYDVSAAERVYWSDEVADIHEVPRGTHPLVADAIGFYAPEWRAQITEVFGRCVREGVPFDEELEIITSGGRRVWVRAVGEAVRDSAGAIVRVQGAFQDITEQKRAEAEIKAVENRLATTLESISDGFMTLDREWRVTYVNGELERLAGLHRSQILGHNLWEIFPDAFDSFGVEYRRALDENRSVRFERYYAGTAMWLEVHAHPTEEGLAVYLRDVTERHHAEERVRQQEARYRAIVEAVNDAIIILDESSRVITANRAACVMHGYPLASLLGRRLAELVHPADLDRVVDVVSQARAGENAYTEAVHLRQDGREVHVVANSASFQLAGVPHVLLVISNVSEQKRLQQELERSARISSLGRLAANIAHEMNNVMMGILPFTEVIRRRTAGDVMLQNATSHIAKSVERGKVVTQEILRFTRSAADPELRSIDGSRLLEDVADELRPTLPATIVLDAICEEGLHVLGDAGQLQQVVTNLVMNARDAMPSGGRITLEMFTSTEVTAAAFVGVDDPRRYVQLRVHDEGTGIPPALLGHIFEPLFTTKGSGGTGLGLAIVHQIVALHGGQVRVDSNPGAGTTFHVLLRKSDSRSVAAPRADVTNVVWQEIRQVVLVEDEPLVAEGIMALLAAEGVACERIELGRPAIERLRTFRPDLLILDIGLPDVSGVEVYRAVAESQKDLLTVFSTGHGDHRLLGELGMPPNVGFISKPYDFAELSRIVAQLRGNRPRR